MFGVEETAHLPESAYAPEVSSDVYQRIEEKARQALRAGQAVVLDATFSTAEERRSAANIAFEVGVAFDGLFLTARLETRLARVGIRKTDVSDADAAVARGQRAEPLGEKGWTEVDAGGALTETGRARAEAARLMIDDLSSPYSLERGRAGEQQCLGVSEPHFVLGRPVQALCPCTPH